MQGKTISGYTLRHQLGVGGMAEVWYAENKIGKKAAVKLLLPKLCDDENVKSRFLTEAKVMVELNHPNIRQVYDYGDIDGRPAIVMEYLDGEDLKTKLKRGQRFKEAELERWWNQLVLALNYTHQKGIVHRDIKPGNIFVDREGNIKLLDFGIAKVRESISSTQTGQKLGTLMYMSPEQVRDSKYIDYRTDIYSLAVTFVHLITGKRPYDSETSSDFEISEQIVYKPLDLRGVPMAWRNFLSPYLEKAAQNRPALRPFEMVAEPQVDDTDDEMEETIGVSPDSGTPSGGSTPSSKGADGQTPPSKVGGGIKKASPASTDKSKNKKALWIALGVAAAAVVALVVVLAKPKSEPSYYNDIVSEPTPEEIAAATGTGDLTITANGVSFVMKRVPGGTFQMGSNDSEANSDEQPVHSVTVSSFYMGETEVSQALWKAVMGSNPSYFKGDNLPMEEVSYDDIVNEFIPELNRLTGRNFRLPTEAEWEYAARGGTQTSLYNGENIVINGKNNSPNLDRLAWYGGNCGRNYTSSAGCDVSNGYDISGWDEKQYADSKGGTHPVGQKQPNAYGLYDMLGNVWEWCQDWKGDYGSGSQTNPLGPSSGSSRVLRGGSWDNYAWYCRVSYRNYNAPGYRSSRNGFRLCLPQ